MKILFEDNDIIVVEKAPGVPVESRRMTVPDMVSLLRSHLSEKNPGKIPYLGVIHRLDQPVGGVMVFAKNQKAAGNLSAQIAKGSMEKTYLAVVTGLLPADPTTLTDYLIKDGRTNTSRAVPKGTKDAKLARLTFHRIAILPKENLSLAKIHLDTGRHHQIRVQMAKAGFPLYGDQKYNPAAPKTSRENVALLACRLTFCHPVTQKKLTFSCDPSGAVFEKFSQASL